MNGRDLADAVASEVTRALVLCWLAGVAAGVVAMVLVAGGC